MYRVSTVPSELAALTDVVRVDVAVDVDATDEVACVDVPRTPLAPNPPVEPDPEDPLCGATPFELPPFDGGVVVAVEVDVSGVE
jgi:hypothetical protein